MIPLATSLIMSEIAAERARQDAKWGEQNHSDGTGPNVWFLPRCAMSAGHFAEWARAQCQANGPGKDTWLAIMLEELAEAFAETGPAELRAELVQVAAVATQWIEAIDRRSKITDTAEGALPTKHASPHCACGINGAGQPYIDPICRPFIDASKIIDTGDDAAGSGSPRRAQDDPDDLGSVDECEGADDAARRFARELNRLEHGLAQMGFPLDDGLSVDEAAVTTALAALHRQIERLRQVIVQRDWAETRTEHLDRRHRTAAGNADHLDGQIKRLADFILAEVDGEPSRSEGAVDTAIRIIRELSPRNESYDQWAIDVARFHGLKHDPDRDLFGVIALHLRTVVEERDQAERDVTRFKTQLVSEQARLRAILARAWADRDEARTKGKEAIDEALKLAEAQLVVIDQRDSAIRERDQLTLRSAKRHSEVIGLRDQLRTLRRELNTIAAGLGEPQPAPAAPVPSMQALVGQPAGPQS